MSENRLRDGTRRRPQSWRKGSRSGKIVNMKWFNNLQLYEAIISFCLLKNEWLLKIIYKFWFDGEKEERYKLNNFSIKSRERNCTKFCSIHTVYCINGLLTASSTLHIFIEDFSFPLASRHQLWGGPPLPTSRLSSFSTRPDAGLLHGVPRLLGVGSQGGHGFNSHGVNFYFSVA